jgi:dihydroneopterin aldolase/dihydroneopterin aldolase/2-amino-4-hydroxy-6-hydroxymethyldihydropteridine diphosphokinase
MRFHVRVGILPHERELAQPLEIDLTVHRAPAARDVLDYRTLYAIVQQVVAAEPLDYLETIAESIVAGVLSLPQVRSARVAVRKPHVALGGPLSHAEIVVEGMGRDE